MKLSESLDYIYGKGVDWTNPIRPGFISSLNQTPYEAYKDLKPEFQRVVCNMIGHEPKSEEE